MKIINHLFKTKKSKNEEINPQSKLAIVKNNYYDKTGEAPIITKEELKEKYIWQSQSNWGHRINYNKEMTRVDGHISSPEVKNHDLLLEFMKSGKIGVFEIQNLKYELDPCDLFFADLEFIGYVENEKHNMVERGLNQFIPRIRGFDDFWKNNKP